MNADKRHFMQAAEPPSGWTDSADLDRAWRAHRRALPEACIGCGWSKAAHDEKVWGTCGRFEGRSTK